MKLISTTDFVLDYAEVLTIIDNYADAKKTLDKFFNYANFLKQKLELWMFVPCDEDGNVLEKPDEKYSSNVDFYDIMEQYQQAKERVLFEGFKVINKGNFYFLEREDTIIWYRVLTKNSKATIENLLKFPIVNLTETAIKQIGL